MRRRHHTFQFSVFTFHFKKATPFINLCAKLPTLSILDPSLFQFFFLSLRN